MRFVDGPATVGETSQTPAVAEEMDQTPTAVGEPGQTRAAETGVRWCQATWLLFVTGAGWLVFVVLHQILSGRWWPWVPLDLAPPIVYAIVPVTLLAALPLVRLVRRPLPTVPRRVVVLTLLVSLGLGLPDAGLNPRALGHGGATPHTGTVRVFVWNTSYWDQDDDPQRFISFLTEQRADVYLLQEYLNWDRIAGLAGARQIDDITRLRHAFPGFAIAIRGELITLSRFPIVAQPAVGPDRAVRADPDATFADIFAAAKVLRTDLLVNGTRLSAYNVHIPVQVHLVPSVSAVRFIRDRHAYRRAHFRGLNADLDANPHSALVAGDFNASSASGEMDELSGRLRDAADASVSPYPATWPADRGVALWRLDWAFTSSSVQAYRYDLRDPDGLSDHRGQHLVISTRNFR